MAIGRHFEARHGDGAHARLIGANKMALARLTTRSISMVSDGTVSCASITTGTRRTMPSRSGSIENSPRPAAACSIGWNVAQQSGKRHQARPRIRAENGKAGLRRRFAIDARRGVAAAVWPTTTPPAFLIASAKSGIVARKSGEFFAGLRVEAAETFRGDGWRHAIGLGEDDVEADGNGAIRAQTGDEIGDHRARPRPLPDLLEAGLVDVDDDDRPRGLFPRLQDLKQIECAQPQFFDRPRVGDAQRHEREQQQRAHRPCHTELPRPASNALHAADPLRCVSDRAWVTIAICQEVAPLAGSGATIYFSRNARLSWSCSGLTR